MFRAFENWQRITSLWLVVWLSAQFVVIAVVPTWGAVISHSHITAGNMTDADWEQHAREHRLGVSAHNAFESGCLPPAFKNNARVIASLPDADGILFFLPVLAAVTNKQRIEIRVCHPPPTRVLAHTFAARDGFESLLEPPPNA